MGRNKAGGFDLEASCAQTLEKCGVKGRIDLGGKSKMLMACDGKAFGVHGDVVTSGREFG